MQDEFIARGQPKYSLPTAGKAPVYPFPVEAIVKSNVDKSRQGQIRVYIPEGTGADANNPDNWKTVKPLGFYGKTVGDPPNTGFGTYKNNPASYGVWHSPPDIGTVVICIFVDGDANKGYYVGGKYDPDALHMVPAIGATDSVLMNEGESSSYGGTVRLPVVNLNNNSKEASAPSNYLTAPKPVHSYAAMIFNQQGLIRDPVRGPISTSAQRETSSRVGWGVSTPGRPIYAGGFNDENIADELSKTDGSPDSYKVVARRGGHSFIMDDGDLIGRNQLVRIRTALGHQITMSDDGQTLFIIHSNGQSYIELGKEGTIDIYGTNSFNVRTQGDINLHADRDINMNAKGAFNLKANGINIQSDAGMKLKVMNDYAENIMGTLTSLVGKAYSVAAGGQASMVASAEAFVNGSKVNLNSGDPATSPEAVEDLTTYVQTDTLFDQEKGFIAAPGKLTTVCSRAPAHAPWANAGQGVDVQVDLGADSNFPSEPSSAVSDVNNAAAAATSVTDTPAVSSSAVQPSVDGVSKSLDKNTTSSVLGSIAQDVSKNPLTSAAASAGAGIIKTPGG